MVAAKQGGNQRKNTRQGNNNNRKYKGGVINGIVAKAMMPPSRIQPPRFAQAAALASGYNPMFSVSQIPDNPGYMDFNEPTPQPPPPLRQQQQPPKIQGKPQNGKGQRGGGPPRRGGNQMNGGGKRMQSGGRNQNANGWGGQRAGVQMSQQMAPPMSAGPSHRGNMNGRNFQGPSMGRMNGGGGRPPPMGMRPPPMGGNMPPPLPPLPNMTPGPRGRFGGLPRPLIPPPLAGCPPPIGPPPPPMGPMMRPPSMRGAPMAPRPLMQRGIGGGGGNTSGPGPVGGPMRRTKNLPINRKNGNLRVAGKKRGPPLGGGGGVGGGRSVAVASNAHLGNGKQKKSTTTKKTLIEIINQYPINKPWVTDEIREEHRKKEDIENRLKGNKNDQLFAEFKVQRDKFVKMYETARLEYIGKHAEQDIDKILTESSGKGEKAKTNANANQKTNEKSAATT